MSTIYKADTLDELRLRIAEHLEQLSQTRRIEANTVNGKKPRKAIARHVDRLGIHRQKRPRCKDRERHRVTVFGERLPQFILTIMVLGAFAGMVGCYMFIPATNERNAAIVEKIITSMGTACLLALGYWFGPKT